MNGFSQPDLQIFDPRKGSPYVLPEREQGQSIIGEFIAISYYPKDVLKHNARASLEYSVLREITELSIARTGTLGFYLVSPITSEVERELGRELSLGKNNVGYFEKTHDKIDSHIKLRQRLWSFEDWVVGSCTRPLNALIEPNLRGPKTSDDALFRYMDEIGAASFFFGETGELLLLTRIYDGIDPLLSRLR